MKPLWKNIIWAVAALFIASLLFASITGTEAKQPLSLSMSEVAKKITAGEVKSLVVNGNELQITLTNNDTATSRKENETGFSETLKNYGVKAEDLQKVEFKVQDESGTKYWMNMLLPILIPVIVMVVMFWWIFRQAKSGAGQAFSFGKVNVRLFAPSKDKATFKDVAGLKEAKEELLEVVEFLKNSKKFTAIGAKIPRGVLLMGSPGTGKTMLARAVAGEAGVPFFHISASEFVEMFVGVGASRVRDLFHIAKQAAPSIIFIDEIDAVGRERGTGMGGGHDEREQTLNQILVEMDGFDRDTSVIVIAATNRPDVLDPALLRPGRFDRRVVLDMPDVKDREDILKIHVKGKPLANDVDLKVVATRTPGFAGADLSNLVNEAAILAARNNRKTVAQEDFLNSVEKVLLGPARRSRVITPKEKEITAYHEAGHALVAAALKDADPVHKVSIVSRGMAGGYTLKLPLEERRLHTKAQFLADLAVSFGGYASELTVFKDVTTGSSSDIRNATDVATRLVTQYGMSEKLGPRSYGRAQEAVFLGRDFGNERDFSESLGAKIDDEVNAYINKALAVAKTVITKNRKALDAIAEALVVRETLEQEEFYAIIKKFGFEMATLEG